MKKHLAIICACIATSSAALGLQSIDQAQHSASVSYGTLRVQTVSEDRILRSAFGINYFYPLFKNLRGGLSILFANDDQPKSQVIVFDENYTWIAPTIEATKAWFFRYSVGFGPAFVISDSNFVYESEVLSESRSQIGYVLSGRIDYSPHQICDLGLFATYNQRLTDNKSDWMWGFQGTFNISALQNSNKGKS